jgi:ankyrin repeat protein
VPEQPRGRDRSRGAGLGYVGLVCLVLLPFSGGCGESIHDLVNRRDAEAIRARIALDPGVVNARNATGKTPLHYAVTYGAPDLIDLLVAQGAGVNAADNTGLTPLHAAAMLGRVEEGRRLLDYHADLEARDQFGDTPLHLAALHGETRMVKLLAEAGADTANENKAGLTARDLARQNRQEDTAEYLEGLDASDD